MKWFKRLLLTFGALAVLLGLVGGYLYFFVYHGTPDWYPRAKKIDPAAEAAAARRVEDKVAQTLNWASATQAQQDRARHAANEPTGRTNAPQPPATQPAGTSPRQGLTASADPLTLSFTEEELNAFFAKWEKLYDWDKKYSAYVSDPAIILHDGRIILAGRSKDLGTVLSAHFDPELTGNTTEGKAVSAPAGSAAAAEPSAASNGSSSSPQPGDEPARKLYLKLDRLLAGNLPLPQSFFDKYRATLGDRLKVSLPTYQRDAALFKDGTANSAAVVATMGKLFLHVLDREPGAPILFLPVPGKEGSMPVQLTDVRVHDKTLSLTIKLLDRAERQSLLTEIRRPYEEEAMTTAAIEFDDE
jgi:hypothetical protein